jgi:hypothetical protein
VAEVTQRRRLSARRWFYGGSTVIIGADGKVRYAIVKHVDSARRHKIFSKYLAARGRRWQHLFAQDTPDRAGVFRGLHSRAKR